MQNNVKDLLDDIIYLLKNLDDDGFSNQKIKEAIKQDVKELKLILK